MDFSVGNKFIGIGYNYAMKKTKKKKKKAKFHNNFIYNM